MHICGGFGVWKELSDAVVRCFYFITSDFLPSLPLCDLHHVAEAVRDQKTELITNQHAFQLKMRLFTAFLTPCQLYQTYIHSALEKNVRNFVSIMWERQHRLCHCYFTLLLLKKRSTLTWTPAQSTFNILITIKSCSCRRITYIPYLTCKTFSDWGL